MKTPLLTIAVLLTMFAHSVRAEWAWLHPTPHGYRINDIEFLDENTAVAVGEGSAVLVTRDSGWSWNQVTPTHAPISLSYIAPLDASTAFTGSGTVMYRTTDAGASWTSVPGPGNVGDVQFLGSVGLAVGAGIWRSSDEGETWILVHSSNGASIGEVCIASPSVAYATQGNTLLRSGDGGQTWTEVSKPVGNVLNSVSFVDPLNGAVTNTEGVRLTADGGQTWVLRSLPSEPETLVFPRDVEMLSPGSILVAATHSSGSGLFLRSNDDGVTWSSHRAPQHATEVENNGNGIVLLGGHGGELLRFEPPDSWVQTAGSHFAPWPESASAFADRNHGIVVGTNDSELASTLLQTSDGGATWTAHELPNLAILDVAFANGVHTVYAVGRGRIDGQVRGVVLKSTDQGATWTLLAESADTWFTGIDVAPDNHAVAVGTFASAFVDADNVTIRPVSGHWLEVAFADSRIVVAVGVEGRARSVDGGRTWDTQADSPCTAITFASSRIGILAQEGSLRRTQDAGVSWTTVYHSSDAVLAVAFATRDYGVAVGRMRVSRTVLETTDGGLSWTRVPVPGERLTTLQSVTCFSPYRAIVTGSSMIVLKYKAQPHSAASSLRETQRTQTPYTAIALLPNQPNPFNPSTTILFTVPQRALVRLSIYDVAGHLVTTLINEVREAGSHSVQWNGTDSRGERVASGVYLSRLESGKSSATRKMLLLN